MRKFLFSVLITFLLFTGPLMSQKQLYFGIAGTAQNTWITNQNNYGLPFTMDSKITFGGSGNVNIGFDFDKHIGLKLEIGYSKLGQNYSDTRGDSTYSRNIKVNYLQVPLLFKYRTNGKVARFYFLVGPQFNFLLSATQKYTKNDKDYDITFQPPKWPKTIVIGQSTITDRFTSPDIMARLDLGADISLGEHLFLNIGLTMAYGLMDINASDFRIPDYSSNTYNASHNIYGGINVGINYVLPLGKK